MYVCLGSVTKKKHCYLAVECYLLIEEGLHQVSEVHYSLMLKVIDLSWEVKQQPVNQQLCVYRT